LVFLVPYARKYMAKIDRKASATSYARFKVMGKEFDASAADKYLASFAIKKAS